MGHSDYPLQALLYAVVLHRFLRWRQPSTTRRTTSAACSTSTCAACAAPTPRSSTANLAGSSSGGRRSPLVDALSDLLEGTSNDRDLRTEDERDRRSRRATGLLGRFNAAGVLAAADVHVAPGSAPSAASRTTRSLLAVALAVRAVRHGSVASTSAPSTSRARELAWPDPDDWVAAVRGSPLVEAGVVRFEHGLALPRPLPPPRDAGPRRPADPGRAAGPGCRRGRRWRVALGLIRGGHFSPEQQAAAVGAAGRWTTVLTGGPGTGKTTTVARILVLLADQAAARGERLSIALAAPTGKAADPAPGGGAHRAGSRGGRRRPRRRRGPGRSPRRAHAAPPAGLAARQQHPLPPRPHQPAQARRGRGRRVLDGRADDDGPAARGRASAGPADPGRRPGAADLGRRRRRAQRPGRRLRRRPRLTGGRAHPQLPGPEDIKALAESLRGGDADDVLAVLRAPAEQVEFVEATDLAEVEEALRSDWLDAAAARSAPRRWPRTPRARSRPSTSTVCCARTARGRTAYAAGTRRSSAGSPRPRTSTSSASGTSAARCW